MGFEDQRRLWSALDRDGSGFVTLDEWDLATYNALLEFRRVCYSSFGGLDCAFAQGMDRKKRSQVYPEDLKAFLSDPIYGFTGNVEVLFRALDLQQQGFFTLDELDFLRSFRGEPHGAASPAAASRMRKERYLDTVGGATTRLPDIHGREQNRQTWAPGDAQRYHIYGNPGAAVTAGLQAGIPDAPPPLGLREIQAKSPQLFYNCATMPQTDYCSGCRGTTPCGRFFSKCGFGGAKPWGMKPQAYV